MHARRLYGFALLLTLGDAAWAEDLTRKTLAAAYGRLEHLGHPEQATGWLRARIVRRAMTQHGRSLGEGRLRQLDVRRTQALSPLGVTPEGHIGLAALETRERAALIARAVERLSLLETAIVVGVHGPGLNRLLRRARIRYMTAYREVWAGDASLISGRVSERVRLSVRRMLH